jgi:hypothetical protein
VLPAICTEEVITLGAELEDGTVIRGQNNISHPDVAAGPQCAGAVWYSGYDSAACMRSLPTRGQVSLLVGLLACLPALLP